MTGRTGGRPLPRVASAILRAALPADWRDDVLRDLDEVWRERMTRAPGGRAGPSAVIRARIWVWWQVLAFGLRFLPVRLREAGLTGLTSLDMRLAVRSARRHWALSTLTVVALAVGIGAAAGAFGLIEGAFFSDLPFDGGDRIHIIEDYNTTRGTSLWVRGEEFVRRREALESFEYFGAFHSGNVALESDRRVRARFVTPDLLRMTGVAPLAGRLPDEGDTSPVGEPVVLLPYDLWTVAFGGDRGVVGSRIEIAGVQRTVIGVMPQGFAFPWGEEIWIPVDPLAERERFQVIGKLREGVSAAEARSELEVVARTDPADLQAPDDVVDVRVTPLTRPITGGDTQLLFLAAPLVALILLLVVMATNVATVVLARNAARTGELSVRVALGASRRRVAGQLVLEVALTVVVAAALGLVVARWSLEVFESRVRDLPFWIDFSLDARLVAFTILLAAVATLVAGLAPALRTTSGGPGAGLRDGARGASALRFGRITDGIIVTELAVSVGFLGAAAILGQSLLSFGFAKYDLPASETLVANVYSGQPPALRELPADESPAVRRRVWAAFDAQATLRRSRIMERVGQLSGVRMVAVGSRFPGDESESGLIDIENGRFNGPRRVERVRVGDGYFELLGAELVEGRDFTPAERVAGAAVAVVDEPFVRAHLGGGNAAGRRVRTAPGGPDEPPGPWLEIVGVVPDLGLAVGDPSRAGTIYSPLGETNIAWLAVRGDGDPNRWTPALLEIAREIDPDMRVSGAQTLEDLMMLPVSLYRGLGIGFLALGTIALLLSAASLHAVTASSVTRRTREMGIRRALGAPSGTLVASTVRRAAVQLGAGATLGCVIGFALLRLSSVLPWRLGAGSPVILGVVPAILAIAVFLALAGPLMRALSIRPVDALRCE